MLESIILRRLVNLRHYPPKVSYNKFRCQLQRSIGICIGTWIKFPDNIPGDPISLDSCFGICIGTCIICPFFANAYCPVLQNAVIATINTANPTIAIACFVWFVVLPSSLRYIDYLWVMNDKLDNIFRANNSDANE